MKGEAYFFGREETSDSVGCFTVSRGHNMEVRLADPACTLKSVGSIVGPNNVWANVQLFDDPAMIGFDITNVKQWREFFTSANIGKYFPGGEVLTV
jgi:hypothetical protein